MWQATRNLTLNLGLRYELNTPVQTYEGLASMLAEDFETIIPVELPRRGIRVHTRRTTRTSARGSAPPIASARRPCCARGFGIYYNPNQMNSFTFLTNNPPLAAVTTYTSDPSNPDAVVREPVRRRSGRSRRPDMISPTRELPSARKDQWSFDVQRELWSGAWRSTSSTSGRTRSTSTAASSTTRRSRARARWIRGGPARSSAAAASSRTTCVADYDAVSLILRKRMSHGLQADLHYTWSRTNDMATHSNGGGQTMNNYDIWADYGPANWDVPHRFVVSYIYDLPFFKSSSSKLLKYVRGRLADRGRDHAAERHPGQHHVRRGPGEHRHRGAPASQPRRRRARAQLPAQHGGHDDLARSAS